MVNAAVLCPRQLISLEDASIQSGEPRLGRIALCRLHRLVYGLVMRDHIQAVLAYPQDGELVAAVEVLLSVYYEGDGSQYTSPIAGVSDF